MGLGHVVLPTIVPVRLPRAAELADFARMVAVLRQAWRLADWLEASRMDSNERFRSPQGRLDAALDVIGDHDPNREIAKAARTAALKAATARAAAKRQGGSA
jgi:hypothetical protein